MEDPTTGGVKKQGRNSNFSKFPQCMFFHTPGERFLLTFFLYITCMVELTQCWVVVAPPSQDLVVEGPYSLCSFWSSSGVQFEVLANRIELQVYRGGDGYDSK
jgi:hypothetical protein